MISGTLDAVNIITVISCDKQLEIGVSAIIYLIYRFDPLLYHQLFVKKEIFTLKHLCNHFLN